MVILWGGEKEEKRREEKRRKIVGKQGRVERDRESSTEKGRENE